MKTTTKNKTSVPKAVSELYTKEELAKLVAKAKRTKKPINLRLEPQKGTNKKGDDKIQALKPGYRIAKNGHIYKEVRADRSDKNPIKKV